MAIAMHRLLISLLMISIILIGASCNNPTSTSYQEELATSTSQVTLPIPNIFTDPEVFRKTSNVTTTEIDTFPIAGIVNHHTLAMDLQARFFKSLKAVRPNIQTFIVLSPDHFNWGPGISYQLQSYATPAGVVDINKDMAESLDELDAWSPTNSEVFSNEHGIGALAPFVAREFPSATIVPIFLQIDYPAGETQKLAQWIVDHLDEKTFLLISSDMSHYLPEDEARSRDEQTLKWLEVNDWSKLSQASDAHTDSRVAFAVLKNLFQVQKEDPHFHIIDHAISTDYGADPNETTSYITGFYSMSK